MLLNSQPLKFFVPGVPIAQPRPSVTLRGKHPHAYVPEDHPVHEFKSRVRGAIAKMTPTCFGAGVPVGVAMVFRLPRPKKCPLHHLAPHAKRPDIDNLAKAVLDAITESGLWRDDGQIAGLKLMKLYADDGPDLGFGPGVVVTIESWE